MKLLIIVLSLVTANVFSAQFVENKRIGLGQRVLMRGMDFVSMCRNTILKIETDKNVDVDECLYYVEGIRTGYAKATTEVVARAALFHVGDGDPKKIDNWEKGLSSKFYENLSGTVVYCNLAISTPELTQQIYKFIIVNKLEKDVLASIYYNFLDQKYPAPCN